MDASICSHDPKGGLSRPNSSRLLYDARDIDRLGRYVEILLLVSGKSPSKKFGLGDGTTK